MPLAPFLTHAPDSASRSLCLLSLMLPHSGSFLPPSDLLTPSFSFTTQLQSRRSCPVFPRGSHLFAKPANYASVRAVIQFTSDGRSLCTWMTMEKGKDRKLQPLPAPTRPYLPGREEASLAMQSLVTGVEKDRKELQWQNWSIALTRPDSRTGTLQRATQRQKVASSRPGAVGCAGEMGADC